MINSILGNPLCAGLVRDGENVIEGRHEALVSRRRWEEVQAIRVKSKKSARGGRPSVGLHLFRTAMLHCGVCGAAMIVRIDRRSDGTMRETYRCYTRYLSLPDCSMQPQRRELIDSAVYAYYEQAGRDAEATNRQVSKLVARRLEEARQRVDAARGRSLEAAASCPG